MYLTCIFALWKFPWFCFSRFRELDFFLQSLKWQMLGDFGLWALFRKSLKRLDRFFRNVHHTCFLMQKCNCKVSLALIHWNSFTLNDKDAVSNDEKVALQIHCLQNYGKLFKIMNVTFLREHFTAEMRRSEAKQSNSCYLHRRRCKKNTFFTEKCNIHKFE